jgi:hypothetical protein
MQERIFTLKAGTEVAKQFDGATIPFKVPTSDAEIASLIPDEKVRVAVFNQAYSLNLQKSVKEESRKEGATVESLRKHAADYKVGAVRTKGPGTGKPRVSQKAVSTVLGDDFLATLTPEQRKLYDAKMAALNVKKEAPAAAPESQPTAPETGKPAKPAGSRR